MTIFIVDDEPKIRNGMGKLLSAHPRWQVQTFADAKSALHRLYEGEADVIITDIQMPDVSGLDMIEYGRSIRPFPSSFSAATAASITHSGRLNPACANI